jgi:hypothetical protein
MGKPGAYLQLRLHVSGCLRRAPCFMGGAVFAAVAINAQEVTYVVVSTL